MDWHKRDIGSSNSDSDRSYQLLKDKVGESDSDLNPWKDVPPRWHTTGDEDWLNEEERSSDSDETSDSHHQTPSRYFTRTPPANHVPHPSKSSLHSPSLCPQRVAHPVPQRRPKTMELCRKWLRNQCDKGYSCHYIHEDLDYDNDPVGVICLLQ